MRSIGKDTRHRRALALSRHAAIAGLVLLGAGAAQAQAPETARLDSIAAVFQRQGFMGCVLVTRGDRVLLDRGYGDADREAGRADSPKTRFPIGSLTKQFTAAAVLLLEERGRLDTRDPVRRWIPEATANWDKVTLHHLLSHTGGIADAPDDSDFVRTTSPLTPGRLAARRYASRPLDFEPGTRFAYSNTDYLLLGAVIEAASGMSYEAFVTKEILAPLGLDDTGFGAGSGEDPRQAVSYMRRDSVWRARVTDLRMVYAAGALTSTTRDLVRWERALYGGRLLGPKSLARMITPVVGDYACGVHHRLAPGREVLYHTGRLDGFQSVLGYYPADTVAIAILSNQVSYWRIEELYDALAAASHRAAGP